MHFSSKFIKTDWKPVLKIGDAVITPSKQAKNLGAIMDNSLSMIDHVNNVVKSIMFGIGKTARYDNISCKSLLPSWYMHLSRQDWILVTLFCLVYQTAS